MATATITHSIEDDILSLRDEKLDRKDFLRSLAEHFVHIATTSARGANGRHEVVVVSATGEEGMFLPVFTSEERFRATPLSGKHESLRVPFDEMMRQIRPDTGVIINPGSDREYMFRWFILQEYIEDFGQSFVLQEATPEWLEQVNRDFIANDVPHGQRAWEAISVWSNANRGLPISMSSPRAERIQEWFRANTNPSSNTVGPIATAAFFHDTAFWDVTIPLCYGSPNFNPLDMLRMPASVKVRFCAEQNDMYVYLKFFADTYDYYYTVEDVLPTLASQPFLAGFIGAGREQITQAAALLLGRRPNAKAAEAARFALEMFFKTFLITKGLSEKDLRRFSHNLEDLLAKCVESDPASQLRLLEPKLALFPDVGARYRTDDIAPRDLWAMYYAAQNAGWIVLQPMSDRDTASTIRLA